jgi:hypothetical protein
MNNLKIIAKNFTQKAENLNIIKTNTINKLEGRLNVCPEEYLLPTKRFIQIIKNNIEARQKLIGELNDKNILKKTKRLFEITCELEEIDKKDIMASDVYQASMDEMV